VILSSRFSTSDKHLDPILAGWLSEVRRISDKLPIIREPFLSVVGSLSEKGATSDKYPRTKEVKPLSEPQVGGTRT